MTDLEITRLCADAAFGENALHDSDGSYEALESVNLFGTNLIVQGRWARQFDPLHDDAQAMALVKKLKVYCAWDEDLQEWETETNNGKSGTHEFRHWCAYGKDLNRAICECVAKMQAAK